MCGCAQVCPSVHTCTWVGAGVSGWVQYARVCMGVCGSARVSASVCKQTADLFYKKLRSFGFLKQFSIVWVK